MARRRYVLRYRGTGPAPPVAGRPGITVVDGSSPRMVLVEGDDEAVAELAASLTEWIVAPEATLALPDPPHHHLD